MTRRAGLTFALAVGLLLSPGAAALAGTAVVPHQGHVSVGERLDVWLDAGGTTSFEELRQGEAALDFEPSGSTIPNLGFTEAVYWFRVQFVNERDAPQETVLELAYPLLDEVTFYIQRAGGQFEVVATGDAHPFDTRAVAHRRFLAQLSFAPGDSRWLYMRVQTRGSLQMPLNLWTEDAFFAMDTRVQLWLGIYFGLMLVMAIYNLFVFLAVRDIDYLYYVMYVASFVALQASFDGVTFQFLWPETRASTRSRSRFSSPVWPCGPCCSADGSASYRASSHASTGPSW